MKINVARVLLHALVLAGMNITAIIAGFVVYSIARAPNQLGVQVPVAVGLSVLGFAAWNALIDRRGWADLHLRRPLDCVWIYLAVIPCAWLIFIPLHYLTRGYLSSGSNLIALTWFQLAANPLVLAIGLSVARRGAAITKGDRHAAG
jgi:hypothetical protein